MVRTMSFEHAFVEIISSFCQLKQYQLGNGAIQPLENHTSLTGEFKYYITPLPGDQLQTRVT